MLKIGQLMSSRSISPPDVTFDSKLAFKTLTSCRLSVTEVYVRRSLCSMRKEACQSQYADEHVTALVDQLVC